MLYPNPNRKTISWRTVIVCLSCLFVFQGFSFNSIFPTRAMGLESSPYNVRQAGMGHSGMASVRYLGTSIRNPSKTGFNTRTTFEALFESDLVYIQDTDDMANTLGSSRIPFLGMSFQAGLLGQLGLLYYQRFEKDFELERTTGGITEPLAYEAGSYELIVTWGKQIYNKYAFGLSYHLLLGEDRQIRKAQFGQEGFVDMQGDTTLSKWSGHYPALSFTYKHKRFSAAAMTTVRQKLTKEIQQRRFNQLSNPAYEVEHDLPLTMGLGFHYRLSPNQNLVLDVSTTDWDNSIDMTVNRSYHGGMGYEFKGMGQQYDPYYAKLAYRAGIGYEKLYVLDVDVVKLTGGIGLPLGKRGSNMDIAFEAGRRGSLETHKVREDYVRLYISFMGAGIWGRSSRAR